MFQKIINKLNDLRPKQLLILAGVAGFLMFVTIMLVMSLLTDKEVAVVPETPPPPAIETSSVVVAKVNIPPRTRLQEAMLQMKELPVDMIPDGAIKNFDEVINVQVKVSIFAGDVLTNQKVFSDKTVEGFVGEIPPDCRAVSIAVTEVTGVAGFAKPGDKVDLLFVEKGQYSATTKILLQNVPLLSVNQDATGGGILDDNGIVKSSAISNPTLATFALPPQEVLKLISASKLGEIYMMLRPASPRANYVEEMEYTVESISTPPPEPATSALAKAPAIPSGPVPAAPLPQIPSAPTVPKIDIIQGDQIVQSSEPQAPTSAAPAQNNSSLPAIPSGATPTFNSPPVPSSPIANVPESN